GQRELLPLAEGHIDASGPRRTQLRLEPRRQARDDVPGAGAIDGGDNSGLVIHAGHVAEADGVAGAKFEAEEILERTRQTLAPLVGRHAGERRLVDEDRSG